MLDGYAVRAQRETGDKITRAEPLAAQAGAGNLKIVKTGDPARDSWIEPFLAEILAFPRSQVKDQVDALSAAYVTLNRCASQEAQWRGSPNLDVARDADYGSASYNDPLESGHPDRSNPDRLRYGSPNNYLDGIRMGHPDRYDEPPDYGSGGDPDALW